MNDKLRIHFGEGTTKSIFLAYDFWKKNIYKLNKKYGDLKIKYLGCLLDKTVSEEAMAHNLIHRINNSLKKCFSDTGVDRPFF